MPEQLVKEATSHLRAVAYALSEASQNQRVE